MRELTCIWKNLIHGATFSEFYFIFLLRVKKMCECECDVRVRVRALKNIFLLMLCVFTLLTLIRLFVVKTKNRLSD